MCVTSLGGGRPRVGTTLEQLVDIEIRVDRGRLEIGIALLTLMLVTRVCSPAEAGVKGASRADCAGPQLRQVWQPSAVGGPGPARRPIAGAGRGDPGKPTATPQPRQVLRDASTLSRAFVGRCSRAMFRERRFSDYGGRPLKTPHGPPPAQSSIPPVRKQGLPGFTQAKTHVCHRYVKSVGPLAISPWLVRMARADAQYLILQMLEIAQAPQRCAARLAYGMLPSGGTEQLSHQDAAHDLVVCGG